MISRANEKHARVDHARVGDTIRIRHVTAPMMVHRLAATTPSHLIDVGEDARLQALDLLDADLEVAGIDIHGDIVTVAVTVGSSVAAQCRLISWPASALVPLQVGWHDWPRAPLTSETPRTTVLEAWRGRRG